MLRGLGLGVLLGIGIGGVAWAQGPTRFDGNYVGELTLTRIIDGDCTPPPLGALYPLEISGGQVRFSYVPRFATTLTGRVARDGTFTAAARVKRGAVQMTGRIYGNNVTAQLASPNCTYTFQTRN